MGNTEIIIKDIIIYNDPIKDGLYVLKFHYQSDMEIGKTIRDKMTLINVHTDMVYNSYYSDISKQVAFCGLLEGFYVIEYVGIFAWQSEYIYVCISDEDKNKYKDKDLSDNTLTHYSLNESNILMVNVLSKIKELETQVLELNNQITLLKSLL